MMANAWKSKVFKNLKKQLNSFLLIGMVFVGHLWGIGQLEESFPGGGGGTAHSTTRIIKSGLFFDNSGLFGHSEYDSSSINAKIHMINPDGSLKQEISSKTAYSSVMLKHGDKLFSFGGTDAIMVLKIDKNAPAILSELGIKNASHSWHIKVGISEDTTSAIYLGLAGSSQGTIRKLQVPTLEDFPNHSLTSVIPELKTITSLDLITTTKLVVAGENEKLYILDGLSMEFPTTASLPGGSKLLKALYNKQDPYNSQNLHFLYISEAAGPSFSLHRAELKGSELVQKGMLDIGSSWKGFLKFPLTNFLLVSVGNDLKLVKATTLNVELTLGATPLFSDSFACCDNRKFVFGFSAPILDGANKQIRLFKADLNFCLSYSGDICISCSTGFRLSDNNANNRCISDDEYPVGFGPKGIGIAACEKSHCDECKKTTSKCSKCAEGFFMDMQTSSCEDSSKLGLYGKDTTATVPTIRKCYDSSCIDCKDNYKHCVKCLISSYPEDGKCISKLPTMKLEKAIWEEDTSSLLVTFSEPLISSLETIKSHTTLTITLLETLHQTPFMVQTLTKTNEDRSIRFGLSRGSAAHPRSVIEFTSKVSVSVSDKIYSLQKYIDSGEVSTEVYREGQGSLQHFFEDNCFVLRLVLLIVELLTVSLSSVASHGWYGLALCRSIAFFSIINRIGGVSLYSSDTISDVLSHPTFLPSSSSSFLDNEKERERLPKAFKKRNKFPGRTSLVGDLFFFMFFFVLLALIGVYLERKKKKLEKQYGTEAAQKKNSQGLEETSNLSSSPSVSKNLTKALPKASLLASFFGVGLAFTFFEASLPRVLQWSFEAIFSIKSTAGGILSILFGGLFILLDVVLKVFLFKFAYTYIDMLYVGRAKDRLRGMGHNDEAPQQGAIKERETAFRNKEVSLDGTKEEISSSILEGKNFKEENTDKNIKDQRKVVYSFMRVFYTVIKTKPEVSTRTGQEIPVPKSALYSPLLDTCLVSFSQLLLVVFAKQPTLASTSVFLFYGLMLLKDLTARPYASGGKTSRLPVHAFLILTERTLMFSMLAVKASTLFSNKNDSKARQKADKTLAVFLIILLFFSIVLSLSHFFRSIRKLWAFRVALKEEASLLGIQFENLDAKQDSQDKELSDSLYNLNKSNVLGVQDSEISKDDHDPSNFPRSRQESAGQIISDKSENNLSPTMSNLGKRPFSPNKFFKKKPIRPNPQSAGTLPIKGKNPLKPKAPVSLVRPQIKVEHVSDQPMPENQEEGFEVPSPVFSQEEKPPSPSISSLRAEEEKSATDIHGSSGFKPLRPRFKSPIRPANLKTPKSMLSSSRTNQTRGGNLLNLPSAQRMLSAFNRSSSREKSEEGEDAREAPQIFSYKSKADNLKNMRPS